MANIPKLTRQQIAAIVNNDERAIRFFEALINRALDETPGDLTTIQNELGATSLEAAAAYIAALSAKAELSRIADALELANRPVPAYVPPDDLTPPLVPARPKYYGVFSDTTTQTAAATATAYAMTFNTTDMSYGVYIGSPSSRVYVYNPGVYNFQFSAQLDKTSGGVGSVYIWARVNGTDVPNSAGHMRLKDNNSEMLAAWNYVLELNAGDYFELMWEVDDTSLEIHSEAASAVHPAIPSVILTVTDNIS